MRDVQKHIVVVLGLLFCCAPGACDRGPLTGGVPDAGSRACVAGSPSPSCCDGAGKRVGSASCGGAGEWTCENSALCTCGGVEATFACSDFCGSDAWVDPTCDGTTWRCPSPAPVRSDSCPAGTCWGEPGDCRCCSNNGAGPRVSAVCSDGKWGCSPGNAQCNTCN